jgi:hypothetical protein
VNISSTNRVAGSLLTASRLRINSQTSSQSHCQLRFFTNSGVSSREIQITINDNLMSHL